MATILDATRGIVFLGTPHRGIGLTTLPKSVASIIQTVQGMDVQLNRDLLDRISDIFAQILVRGTFSVFSFHEELAEARGRSVYSIFGDGTDRSLMNPVGSAIGDEREWRDTIHADHINMVKFSGRTDGGYIKVQYAIIMLLKKKLNTDGQST